MRTVLIVMLTALVLPICSGEPKDPPCKEPALRAELLRRQDVDQAARDAQIDWMNNHSYLGRVAIADLPADQKQEIEAIALVIKKTNDENKVWLRSIIEVNGWPGNSMVGKDGAMAAWLLAQHADADLPFQHHCLDAMKKLPKGEVDPQLLAYLTDRTLLAEGKKQLYGTQYSWKDNQPVPRPIEDEARVDTRRKEVGLSTLKEYLTQVADNRKKQK